MAQTCGLFAGHEAKLAERPVVLGMLLGTRRFQAQQAWFGIGQRFVVRAELVLREGGMGVFQCSVAATDGRELASAQLTTYQAAEADA
jgi:predicted hotdog family 3-hydroxylacyl-ACP dehydratase